MTIFVNQTEIIESARSISNSIRAYRADSGASGMDGVYETGIANLRNIISTGECLEEARNFVESLLDEMTSYQSLGVICNKKFSPISPFVAARFGFKPGQFVSGHRYLCVSKDQADAFLSNGEAWEMPKDTYWDDSSGSLVHASYYYRRNPLLLRALDKNEIDRLNLSEPLSDLTLKSKEK